MQSTTPWNSFRSSKWFKPSIALVAIIGVLFIALLTVPRLIDINTYRGQIIAQIEQQLGRKVMLGAMNLRVLPSVKVRVDELQIGDDPQFAAGEFVKAKSVRLQLGLWSLLRGNPQVSGIELVEPDVTLIKTAVGQWNWGTLKPLQSTEKDSGQAPFDLLVTNGSFKLIDRTVTPATEKTYTGVNAALNNFSPHSAFDFVISLLMPGTQAGRLELKGNAGPIDAKDATQTPMDAKVKMEQVELAGLETLFGLQAPHTGKLTLDAQLVGKLADGLKINGKINAEQLRLVADAEPARNPLEMKFRLTAKTEKTAAGSEAAQTEIALDLVKCDLTLGKTEANFSGKVSHLPARPMFDLQLNGDKMALESLLESANAFGFGPPAGTKASGAATINLHVRGEQSNFALEGQSEFRDLKFQSPQLPQAIQISELKLNFDPQTITAAPFSSSLSRTTVEFKGLKITNYGSAASPLHAHLEISTSNAELGDLLKIAESFGARPDATGSGAASLTATIDADLGQASGSTQINGQGKLTGARLQPSQLKKPLEIANAELRFTGDSARVDNLQAQLGSSQANGWLQIKNFNQPVLGFDLKANQLNVSELQQALNSGSGGASGKQGKSASSSLRGDGQVFIGKLIMDTLTATDVQSKVIMLNNVITLAPVTMKLYGGSYQGSVRIDQSGGATDLALTGKFGGLDINQFLSASGSKSMIYGTAAGAIDVHGRGTDGNQLAQSLLGNGAITINNGKFTSFDLMKQVEVLGKFLNLPTGGAGTAFRSLKTNLKFDHGKLSTDALQLLMDDLQVNGDGWMQLGDAPTVNYDLLAKLGPALSKRVAPASDSKSPLNLSAGFSSVVGNFFMDQGSIAVPIKMAGPLTQPSFGLNSAMLQRRAKDQIKDSLLERFNKAATPADQKSNEKGDEKKPAEKKTGDLLKGMLDKLRPKEKP